MDESNKELGQIKKKRDDYTNTKKLIFNFWNENKIVFFFSCNIIVFKLIHFSL